MQKGVLGCMAVYGMVLGYRNRKRSEEPKKNMMGSLPQLLHVDPPQGRCLAQVRDANDFGL